MDEKMCAGVSVRTPRVIMDCSRAFSCIFVYPIKILRIIIETSRTCLLAVFSCDIITNNILNTILSCLKQQCQV